MSQGRGRLQMLDPATVKSIVQDGGLAGLVILLVYMGVSQFINARAANSKNYPARDVKHDANQGELREIKTMIEANGRNRERERGEDREWLDDRLDHIEEALRRMETIGEVLKDRQSRS